MGTQWIVAGISVLVFAGAVVGYLVGCRETWSRDVILTTEEEVTAMSRRTRWVF